MEIASKGLMPRLTPMLRFAFALAAIFPFAPLVFVLAMYGLFPGAEYFGPPPSSTALAVGITSGTFFVAFVGLAVTGWNPLHRFDVAAADLRAELEAASVDASKTTLWQRISFAVLIGAALYLINWIFAEGVRRGIEVLFR